MPTEPMTIQADWVVTMDGAPLRSGRVVVEAGRIAAVGPASEVAVRGLHRNLGQAVLLPGLVNAHCHLELSAWHGALGAGELWSWLQGLIRLRLRTDAATREQAAVPAAIRSMLQAGTTCVGDISRAAWLPAMLACEPIRKVCYIELISGGISPPANMAQLEQCLSAAPRDPLLVRAITPHTPYTVTGEDLRACAALARREQLPLAIHLAETSDEVEWLRYGTGPIAMWHAKDFRNPPKSPLCGAAEYALAMGLAEAPAAALIHMNHADDWQRLCDLPDGRRPVVVYCPRSHAYFGHERPHPFGEMLGAGLAVAIGTDSAASHLGDEPRPLSVLDELRWLHAAEPDVTPAMLLKMATIHGAAALGMADRIGRIAPGFEADLMAVTPPGRCHDPVKTLLETDGLPSFVCVAGREVGCGHGAGTG